jgi:hypothetical protein
LQNRYARSVLDNLPERQALEQRLRPLMQVGSITLPIIRANRYFFSKREGDQNQPVVYWRDGYKGESKILVDPSSLDPSGLTTIEWISPSEDGRLLAYGTFRSGDELTTLHLLEVDSGRLLDLEIPNKTWRPTGCRTDRVCLRNLKQPKDPYSGQILFHRRHRLRSGRAPVRQFPEPRMSWRRHGGPPRACNARRSLARAQLLDRHKSNDLWLVDFAQFLERGTIESG